MVYMLWFISLTTTGHRLIRHIDSIWYHIIEIEICQTHLSVITRFPLTVSLWGSTENHINLKFFISPLSPSLSTVTIFYGSVIRIGWISNASETICWFDHSLNDIGRFWWIFKTIFNNLFCFIDEVLWKIFLGVSKQRFHFLKIEVDEIIDCNRCM